MTKATEIITSLSIGYKKACDDYKSVSMNCTDKNVKDMYFNLMTAAKNALMYYVAGYFRDSETEFNVDTYGGWTYKLKGEIVAAGYDDAVVR